MKRSQAIAIILVISFSATLIHIPLDQQIDNISIPDATGASVSFKNLSNGEIDICTYNNTPSYYNITEGHYSQTEYSFNLSWFVNRQENGLTGNQIIVQQSNKTLISIEYGRVYDYSTTISGKENYTDILKFSKCLTWYNVSIVLSNNMKNHAIIMRGNGHNSIPYVIALKNPYRNGNITFMFGGKYSNQTIGRIAVKNYTGLITPRGAITHNIGLKSSNIVPYQVYGSSMVFLD